MNIRTNRLHSEKRAKAARGADNEHLGCYEFYNFKKFHEIMKIRLYELMLLIYAIFE